MHDNPASWTVDTSFLLEPDGLYPFPLNTDFPFDIEVRVKAFQTAYVERSGLPEFLLRSGRQPHYNGIDDVVEIVADTGDDLFPEISQSVMQDGRAALTNYVLETASVFSIRRGEQAVFDLLLSLHQNTRVPDFGSAPNAFQTLGSWLQGGAVSGVVYFNDGQPVAVVLAGVTTTVIVRILFPVADGVGETLKEAAQLKLREWLGLGRNDHESD